MTVYLFSGELTVSDTRLCLCLCKLSVETFQLEQSISVIIQWTNNSKTAEDLETSRVLVPK